MFSNVDESVLRLVLDTNGGRMETTVENLLQMTGEQQATDQAAAPNAPGPVAADVAAPIPVAVRPAPAAIAPGPAAVAQEPAAALVNISGVAAPLIDSSERRQDNVPAMEIPSGAAYVPPAADSTSPPRGNSPRRISTARHDLPANFLRPPSYFHNEGKMSASEQEKEDEKLAQILQDSLFMADLQKHPEWLLDKQGANAVPNAPKPPEAQSNWSVGNSGSVNQGGQAEYTRSINDANNNRYESFKTRVSGLGTAAKSRLAMLAEKLKRNENQESSANYQALGSDKYQEPPRPNQNL